MQKTLSRLIAPSIIAIAMSACAGSSGGSTLPEGAGEVVTWQTSMTGSGHAAGNSVSMLCPPAGTPSPVWGTDTYSDDSSVCTAAVHAGVIGFEAGGQIRVILQEGQDSYLASDRNGVSTLSYGPWGRSFAVSTP